MHILVGLRRAHIRLSPCSPGTCSTSEVPSMVSGAPWKQSLCSLSLFVYSVHVRQGNTRRDARDADAIGSMAMMT